MKKLLLLSFFSLPAFFVNAQLTNKSLTIGATTRTYKQYLPAGFDPGTESVSVIIALHGLGGTSNDIVGTGLNTIADTARIIVFYPQGVANGYGQTAWNNGTLLSSSVDDISFMNQLMDTAILNFNADPTRVYVAGFSMGSIMSYHLACAMNNRIAAIGCMSGTMATSDISSCVPAYVTPVIHFHGTSDGTVPYNTNPLPSLSLVPQTIDFWKTQHACGTTADSTRLADTGSDSYTVDRFVYDNCSPTGSLEHWRINGADHEYFYKPVNDFDEITETWLFFRKWQHNSPAAAGINENKETQFSVSPNPSEGSIEIESKVNGTFELYNASGALVTTGKVVSGTNNFNWESLESGIYLISINGTTQRIAIK